jgi:chloride channel protein, CIC family
MAVLPARLGVAGKDPVVAYADEPLRVVVYRMAETGFARLPVLATRKLASMIDLLRAGTRSLREERRREGILRSHPPFAARGRAMADRNA